VITGTKGLRLIHAIWKGADSMEGTDVQVQNNSEVARLLQQIGEQYASAKLGLFGVALGTTKHEVITAKMERIAALHEELRSHVGDDAMALVVAQLEAIPDQKSPSLQ
jgi:hypothetical protein